ncbi:MAG: bile acid:sodium symporter family protein, partial [Verrucomicrobiota bacterium]|nr:bile acid:sodium symporter family protein [Verrucomicrobiota bacterium]
VAATLLLHVGGFGLGYGLARAMKLNELSCRTVSIEVGMQNSGLGTALAKAHFTAATAVPCAVSAVMHCLLGSVAAGVWRLRKAKQDAGQQ